MSNEIRLLNLERDMPIIREAWSWKNSAPKWFCEALDIYKEPWEEYIEQFPKELHYGVFVDENPTAIIRLIETVPYVFNIHLEAKRKTDFNVLLQAGESVRDYLFNHDVKLFYGLLPAINRGVSRLYTALGFTETDYQHTAGIIHGRPVVWKQYVLANPKMLVEYSKIA